MARSDAVSSVNSMDEQYVADVLVIGAGPVGLTLALALARCGVKTTVIDRSIQISEHARARFINARGMEILHWVDADVESAVRAAAIPHDQASIVIWAPSLTGPEVQRVEIETLGPKSGEPLSPSPGVTTSQDRLDPILREAVRRSPVVDLRLGLNLVGIQQDASGVNARCVDDEGHEIRLRTRYAVGADGARSTVRRQLGIEMLGSAALGHQINITFQADLQRALRGRPVNLAMILNPSERGLLLNIDAEGTWTTQAIYSPEAGQGPEAYTDERCVQVIRTHVGDPDLEVRLVRSAPWVSAARVAERFSQGRLFLVGDAAHEMPPAGGFGMNTGFGDAHNLAWKLAAVLQGWGGVDLLDTYDAERRPVATWITDQTLRNLASVGRVAGQEKATLGRPEFFRELGMVFGARYESTAVVPDAGEPPTPTNPVTEYVPSGFPGCRAPHVWLDVDGQRRSTLDLFGPWFTALVADENGPPDVGAVPMRTLHTVSERLLDLYKLRRGDCALVRPDGYVAWRGPTQHAGSGLASILGVEPAQLVAGAGRSASVGGPPC